MNNIGLNWFYLIKFLSILFIHIDVRLIIAYQRPTTSSMTLASIWTCTNECEFLLLDLLSQLESRHAHSNEQAPEHFKQFKLCPLVRARAKNKLQNASFIAFCYGDNPTPPAHFQAFVNSLSNKSGVSTPWGSWRMSGRCDSLSSVLLRCIKAGGGGEPCQGLAQ